MNLQHLPGIRAHALDSVRSVLDRAGEPLDESARADLEPRLGADLSGVRVHADDAAHASARQFGANAYTVGQHVVFGAGRYAPGTAAGRELLAHEATHTVQQGEVRGVPSAVTDRHHPSETAARAGDLAPTGPAIAREEGTAEVLDSATQYQQAGSVFTARMRRDQYRTPADAQRARAGGTPAKMDVGWANVSLDTTTGALTVPVTVNVRHATAADTGPLKSDETSSSDISAAKVTEIANAFIDECNSGLNGWFTCYVPPCQGIAFAGRELPITVQVVRTAAANPDFTVAVSQHSSRSFVSNGRNLVVLYAGGMSGMTARHEGAHMALGVPDEYEETDAAMKRQFPLQKGNERVRNDFTLAGESHAWGIFTVLRARHFSFVPTFVHQVLTSLGHPECMPVLHEVQRPQPHLLRISAGMGGSNYGSGMLHLEAGVDSGRFLDRDRTWRAFLGVHGHSFVAGGPDEPNGFLLGARLGFERKWNAPGFGFTLEPHAEAGGAVEIGGTKPRGLAPYVGVGGSAGISGWTGGGELQLKLTGGEVFRLDREGYRAFQAGLVAAYSW